MIEPLGLLLATLAGPLRSQRGPGLASAASTGTGDPTSSWPGLRPCWAGIARMAPVLGVTPNWGQNLAPQVEDVALTCASEVLQAGVCGPGLQPGDRVLVELP